LDSPEYAAAYREVQQLGGDGLVTPTTRTAEQTLIGIFWAYDGTPSLCAPPRLYNQITMRIAHQMGTDTDVLELARLLALVNVAMADAGIAIWESKFYYQYWRPVTAIRESDEGTGPTGHAGFGGALFEILRKYYRTDRIQFTFISDEFNGVTKGNNGTVRPVVERSFSSLSEAEEENGQSRIYLGIHWAFDKIEGIAQGRHVADYVFTHFLLPGH